MDKDTNRSLSQTRFSCRNQIAREIRNQSLSSIENDTDPMIRQVVDDDHRLSAEDCFSLFKHRFGKSYRSKEEHKYRFNIFKVKLHRARQHQNLDPIAVHSVTLFFDMTPSEFWKVLGLRGLRFPAEMNKAANQCSSPVALIGEAVKTNLKYGEGD